MTAPRWMAWLSPLGWIAVLIGLILLMVVGWWLLNGAERRRDAAARAKAGAIVATRDAKAGRDAIGVVVGNAAGEKSTDQSVKESTDEIRKVPEPERNAATLRALCLRDAARRDPACRQLRDANP